LVITLVGEYKKVVIFLLASAVRIFFTLHASVVVRAAVFDQSTLLDKDALTAKTTPYWRDTFTAEEKLCFCKADKKNVC